MSMTERESLAEDLLLLAIHDEHGTLQLAEKQMQRALATATVMDLLIAGKIAPVDGQVIVVDHTPMNDPVRDGALSCIAAAKTRPPLSGCSSMVETTMPDLTPRLCDQLVARGVLHRQSYRKLGLLPAEYRFPERDGRIEQGVRAQIRAVALQGAQPDARIAVLAALIASYRLETGLFNDTERPIATARLREIAMDLHTRTPANPSAATGEFAAGAHTAGITNVSGNAFMDFVSDVDFSVAFELLFDVIPSILGGLLELFDS